MASLVDQLFSIGKIAGDTITQVSRYGLSRPPQAVVDQIKQITGDPRVQKQLHEFGLALGELIWAKAVHVADRAVKAPAPDNPWLTKVVLPVLDPIIAGVQETISGKVRTIGIIVGIGLAT